MQSTSTGAVAFLDRGPVRWPISEVRAIAERVREALDRAPLLALPGGEKIAISASLGGASSPSFPFDSGELLLQADAACYEAKRLGRNRVEIAESVQAG